MLVVTYAPMAENDLDHIRAHHPGHASRILHLIARWSQTPPSDCEPLTYPKNARMITVELGKSRYAIVFLHRDAPQNELRVVAVCSSYQCETADIAEDDRDYFDISLT